MLELAYKHKLLKIEHWDVLLQDELIELFRRINSQWFNTEGRLELSRWLYTNQCSVKFLVKKIKIGKHKFYGPKEGFRNVTMGEFLFADTYYFMYLNEKDPELLDKFIASLFRERKPLFAKKHKDIRIDFDETLINARAKVLESLTFETKQAILFNYGAVRKDMTRAYKFLFPKRKRNAIKNVEKNTLRQAQSDKVKKIPIPQWENWMWKLSAGNTDEDFDKVANSLVRNILKKIDSLIEESKKK